MKLNAYTIFDSAAEVYRNPLFARADGEVVRVFTDLCTRADHDFSAHPEHYTLWRIGSYNDNTGELEKCHFVCLAKGHEVAAASQAVDIGKLEDLEAEVVELTAGEK